MSKINFRGTFISVGTTRIVWVIPKLHIVVKLARINIKYFLGILDDMYILVLRNKTGNGYANLKKIMSLHITSYKSPWFGLLCGLYENWCEFAFFIMNRKQRFLVPAYFSLLGLINFMKYCPDLPLKGDGSEFRIEPIYSMIEITNRAVLEDGHHFQNQNNFGVVGDRICMRDYGGKKTRKILREHFNGLDQIRINNLKPGPTWK